MTRIWTLLLSAMLICSATATAQTRVVTAATSRPPQVWIDPALGKLQPIQLQDVTIDVHIEGFIASTTLDLTFFNPNNRVLEGELVFPLASGQTITGYALEVAGKLRQGVVVEKEIARVAFESTERRGIDPGLAELTRGNVFRTRLYPIPASGTKRVAVSFDQPLLDAGAAYRYVLPLQFAQKIRHFKVHAEAIRAEHKPQSSLSESTLSFARWHDSFVADLERTDFQPDKELAFSVDKAMGATTAFSVQDRLDPEWRTFAAQVQTSVPEQTNLRAAPKRITLFYDASASARTRNRARELNFLDTWFAQLKDVDVELIAFRNDADSPVTFHIRNGDSSALRVAVEALPLDGGTSYGAIRVDASAKSDAVMVLGDGLSNFGDSEPHLTYADGTTSRIIFAHAAQLADNNNLDRLARRVGGQVINLVETSEAEALRQIASTPWMMQALHIAHGECVDLAPATPLPVGRTVNVYGRCRGEAQIDLQFGNVSGASKHQTLTIDQSVAVDPDRGGFITRLWAAARIADLQSQPRPDEVAITDLAKRFGIVTESTSMLVLDRIEDYVHYRVEPKEPDLLERYQNLLATQAKSGVDDVQKQQHLSQVLAWWTEFKKWHETRHPWLETVLAPAADIEVTRWRALGSLKDASAQLAKAEILAKRATKLQNEWLREGADPAARIAWEREATNVMLALDALRQHRLAIAPDSDQPREAAAPARQVAETYIREDRQVLHAAPAPPPPAAPPPPPPPPVSSAAPVPEAAAVPLEIMNGANTAQARSADKSPSADTPNGTQADSTQSTARANAKIQLQDWSPGTPYLVALRSARDPYAAYLQEREQRAATPSFFLDCADYFRREAKNPRIALRVLSNLAEIDIDNAPLIRVLAYRLEQWDRFDLAVPLFEGALKLRAEEPQSYRDLALALTRQPSADFSRALNLLWQVVSRPWDARFPEIQTLALHELNDALARAPEAEHAKLNTMLEALGVDHRLLEAIPVDLRVVLTWDADDTDIDLWVIDPTGEVAIYNHPRTKIGGHMSRDFTGGYGPEVFTIRRPIPGTYTVKANYFGSRQQKLTGDVTVQAEFLTQFDTGQSKREAITRRLENKKDLIEVGKFVVGAN